MARHSISKLQLLEYALDGAVNYLGIYCGEMNDDEYEQVEKDIEELQRRIAKEKEKENAQTTH